MAKKRKTLLNTTVELTAKLVEGLAAQGVRLQRLASDFENFVAETRFAAAAARDVTSAQTDRIGKHNGIVEQMTRQVNAGFQQLGKEIRLAGEGLNRHERDIANLQTRLLSTEQELRVLKTPKSKGKR